MKISAMHYRMRDEIAKYAASGESVEYAKLAEALGIQPGTAKSYLCALINAGLITRVGRGRGASGRFVITDPDKRQPAPLPVVDSGFIRSPTKQQLMGGR